MSRLTIALGGNALGSSPAQQQERLRAAGPAFASLAQHGHTLLIAHGNGPQVGMIQMAFDTAAAHTERVCPMPLPECTAMSQGYIGFHIQNSLKNAYRAAGLDTPIATVVTQVAVDRGDPAFSRPSKPIGSFYMEAAAATLMKENPQWTFREDAGRGWRRVVPSPLPVEIVEIPSIRRLLDVGVTVIAAGGGGIPVCRQENGGYHPISAVIDKDFAAAAMAEAVKSDLLLILTAVPHVYLHFGTDKQEAINGMTCKEAEQHIESGAFAAGSMLPKVQAAMAFARTGRRAVIAALEDMAAALIGNAGTVICP